MSFLSPSTKSVIIMQPEEKPYGEPCVLDFSGSQTNSIHIKPECKMEKFENLKRAK